MFKYNIYYIYIYIYYVYITLLTPESDHGPARSSSRANRRRRVCAMSLFLRVSTHRMSAPGKTMRTRRRRCVRRLEDVGSTNKPIRDHDGRLRSQRRRRQRSTIPTSDDGPATERPRLRHAHKRKRRPGRRCPQRRARPRRTSELPKKRTSRKKNSAFKHNMLRRALSTVVFLRLHACGASRRGAMNAYLWETFSTSRRAIPVSLSTRNTFPAAVMIERLVWCQSRQHDENETDEHARQHHVLFWDRGSAQGQAAAATLQSSGHLLWKCTRAAESNYAIAPMWRAHFTRCQQLCSLTESKLPTRQKDCFLWQTRSGYPECSIRRPSLKFAP